VLDPSYETSSPAKFLVTAILIIDIDLIQFLSRYINFVAPITEGQETAFISLKRTIEKGVTMRFGSNSFPTLKLTLLSGFSLKIFATKFIQKNDCSS